MAQLQVQDFLVIKRCDVPLRRITVLIGPQAQGKSVLAKLSFFFERLTSSLLRQVATGEKTLAAAKKDALRSFTDIFPKYAWPTKSFALRYESEAGSIDITRSGNRTNSPARLNIDRTIESLLDLIAGEYSKQLGKEKAETAKKAPFLAYSRRGEAFRAVAANHVPSSLLSEPIFVPAGRSFFANIERNVFSLMANKLEIDPLIAEFGSNYEFLRSALRWQSTSSRRVARDSFRLTDEYLSSVVRGAFVIDGEDEYIETDKRRVKLINSSSGQQEALPMVLMLRYWSRIGARVSSTKAASFFIEEPEAHLFPSSQREVARMLARTLGEDSGNKTLITTHSPYFLSAINNLALAGRVFSSLPADKLPLVEAIVPRGISLVGSDLAAYRVEGGEVRSIMDADTGLVNAYLLDEVSETFSEEFDRLLALLPENGR